MRESTSPTNSECFPLSSSQLNGSRYREPTVPIHAPRKASHRPPVETMRYAFLIRIGIFIVVELGFISLGAITLINPIPLHLSPAISLPEAKGLFTFIFIIWHAIAVLAVKDVLFHIFSAEWMEKYRKTGSIVLGETDGVSRITSGIVDQLQHFCSRVATPTFRLSFICVLLVMALDGLGPSTITVSLLERPRGVSVANLTVTSNNSLAIGRANFITRVERLQKATVGFLTQNNTLIPWPSFDLISTENVIRYQSDVISYNFDCSWNQPTTNDPMTSWTIDNQDWDIYRGANSPVPLTDGLILPMEQGRVSAGNSSNPLSAFVFIGSNSTLSQNVTLNLEDTPTSFIPSNPGNNITSPVLASALVCQPRLNIAPATVTLSGVFLRASTLSGRTRVKNAPMAAANIIFSESLLLAANLESNRFGTIACTIFLDPSCQENNESNGFKPLPLGTINQQMNTITRSSAKVYLSGSTLNGSDPVSSQTNMIRVNGVEERQKMALVASEPFLIALSVVVGVLIALLIASMVVVRIDQLRTFDLENIIRTLKMD